MTVFFLIASIAVNIIAGIVIFNLLRQVEKLEDTLGDYDTFYEQLLTSAQSVYGQLKRIDLRGSFEADDEVGVIYQGIKNVVLDLTDFIGVERDEDKNQKIAG